MQSEQHATFKARLLKRFLYDATLCALKSSARKESSLLEIPKARGHDTSAPAEDLDYESEGARHRYSKGIFARLKKAKAARSPPGSTRNSQRVVSLFDERELFVLTGCSTVSESCSQSSELTSSEYPTRGKNAALSIPRSIIDRKSEEKVHPIEAKRAAGDSCLDAVENSEEDNDSAVNLEVLSVGG